MKQYKLITYIFLLFFHTLLFSHQNILDKAVNLNLHTDEYWRGLLHFEGGKSIITDQDFFVAKDGNIDPKNELIATLESILKSSDFQCKYPARVKWLENKLDMSFRKNNQCKALDHYLLKNYKKLHIVFTSQRYDIPDSLFGHIFLKVNTNDIEYAINYTAQIPKNKNHFAHIYKGLNGKYPSSYTLSPFSQKDYEYRAKEFRDLFQFELEYSKQEIENIMLHLYEIQDIPQDYYFISRNCSSELLKLLNMANYQKKIQNKSSQPTLPVDIIYHLEDTNRITNISTQYSKLKLFYQYEKKLNNYARDILERIILHKQSINALDHDNNLNFESKKDVILASILYIEILSYSQKFDRKYTYSLLKLIDLANKYKLKRDFESTKNLASNPLSNKLHKISFATQHNTKSSDAFTFGYKYLSKNRFDFMQETAQNGTVEFFDIKLKKQNDKLKLDKLILFNIEAMPLSNNFFTNNTKKVTLGAKRLFYEDDLYNFFNYGLGYKRSLYPNINYHFMGSVGLYYFGEPLLQGSLQSSIEYLHQNTFTTELKLELHSLTNGQNTQKITLNKHLRLNKSTVINLIAQHNKNSKEYINFLFQYTLLF